ncbi:MAG: DNA polymerase III subunit beta [Myxococcota bacterium]
MELRIGVAELLKALNLLQGVAQRKSSMPVLSHVLLQASQHNDGGDNGKPAGQLSLSATDLETAMRMQHDCHVQQPGSVVAPARALLDVVRTLPGPDALLFCEEGKQLQVHSGRVRAQLLTLPAQEFPGVVRPDDVALQRVNARRFADMVHKTLYCTSTDDNRFALTGVCCEPLGEGEKGLVMAATDGHRLSRVRAQSDSINLGLLSPVIIPRKGLAELIRLLQQEEPGEDDGLELGFVPGQAVAIYKGTLLTMRLIDGAFPDYHQVIPKLSDKLARVSRADLLATLRRCTVLVSDKHQGLKWSLAPGELEVHCHNPEAGEVSDAVAVEYDGPALEIGVNARYAVEALSSMDEENVQLRLTDSLSPVLLTGAESNDHQCVVMPMRV